MEKATTSTEWKSRALFEESDTETRGGKDQEITVPRIVWERTLSSRLKVNGVIADFKIQTTEQQGKPIYHEVFHLPGENYKDNSLHVLAINETIEELYANPANRSSHWKDIPLAVGAILRGKGKL